MSQTRTFDRLSQFIRTIMQRERIESARAFAAHYNLPRMTVQRLLDGQRVDPESLNQVAEALKVPPELLFRLCGYLPSNETRNLLLDELEAILRNLPLEEQRRIRDKILEQVQRLLASDDDNTSSP